MIDLEFIRAARTCCCVRSGQVGDCTRIECCPMCVPCDVMSSEPADVIGDAWWPEIEKVSVQ